MEEDTKHPNPMSKIHATPEQIVEAIDKWLDNDAELYDENDSYVYKLVGHRKETLLNALSTLPTEQPIDENVHKLQAFKDYVHKRLDDARIEKEPNGEHSKHGCRIGDRLDIALKPLDEREVLTAILREVVMRNQLLFPETDQDDKWFHEGMSKADATFMEKLFELLQLGNYKKYLNSKQG